jgi:hypothetical protein
MEAEVKIKGKAVYREVCPKEDGDREWIDRDENGDDIVLVMPSEGEPFVWNKSAGKRVEPQTDEQRLIQMLLRMPCSATIH